MRYCITSNLRIYQRIGKICFPLTKIEFSTYLEFCAYHRIFALGKAVNIYINYLMFYASRQHVKLIQVYKFTFSNGFTMNRKLNFSVTRMTLGMYLSAGE